ncbi:murein hydrolase activator EnvC family protein [Gracilimonas sp.]|uniref:murein hydrolase activator EnvC family protein n=1 Tax=Gracilimonas sp. TaxID=1974203 RepID=UPI00287150DA|nr:peptidoglycan DD-metalloendopeptidase family protein [Gracilimonas sp.]
MSFSNFMKASIGFLLILLMSVDVTAQSYEQKREELLKRQENTRAEINVLEARIRNYQERINNAEKRFDNSFQQLQSFNNLIALQDDKIQNLEDEQQQIQAEIELTEKEIELRELELEQLIENYRNIILYAYKNGRKGNLELLLTSESINQMLVRANYLRRFEEQKNKQAEIIRRAKKDLDQVKANLENSYQRNRELLSEIRDEKQELGDQRQQQEQTVEQIKQERSEYLEELRKTREQRENLESSFAELIEEEERLRAEENASPVTRENFVSDEVLLTYEEAFSQSKGLLPWPVNSTTVAKQFGRVRNPLYGTNTEHPGIDIVADAEAPVRAISPGYVIRILPILGYGNVVVVRHGAYYTLYGNLSSINVEMGTVLQEGDIVGNSGTPQSELGEVLFFAVREGDEFVNPEVWLRNQ